MSSSQKRKRKEVQDGNEARSDTKRLNAACTACRKQKIKCEIINDEPPCRRCRKRGLPCVLHTAQRQPIVDHKQIRLLSQDMANIHSSLQQICQQLQCQPPRALLSSTNTGDNSMSLENAESGADDTCELSPPVSPSVAQAPIDTYLTNAQHGPSPNGDSLARLRRRGSEKSDLISKGLISREIAEHLVETYLRRLDRFLYGLASHYRTFDEVRQASPALLSAICAVTALHETEFKDAFEICNKEFRALVSASLFEKRNTEHIRALCIASFWLPDASRILVSDAIRRAADCRLHRCFHRLAQTAPSVDSKTHQNDVRDKIRLWYMLYVVDQHLSILHNRDSILRPEKDAIEHREYFFSDETSSLSDDVRLMSQISLLVIMGQIKDAFGSEQSKPLLKSSSVQLMHFERELDQWFAEWSPRFKPDHHIGGFPLAGLTMHYQFGRLYLAHHIFRGLKEEPVPRYFLAAAGTAREAAITIFSMLVDNQDFRENLVGMPHYFHIMISFAAQFLLELCTKYREQLGMDVQADLQKVSAALALFARTKTMPQHPIARVTTGLMRKLNQCTDNMGIPSMLTASPFDNAEHAGARDTAVVSGANVFSNSDSTMDMDIMSGLSNEFMFADFPAFDFQNSQFGFT